MSIEYTYPATGRNDAGSWREPPEGWLPFGSLIDYDGPRECSDETGEDGLPLWERPLPPADAHAEKDAACPVCGLDYLTECSCTRQPPPDAEKDALLTDAEHAVIRQAGDLWNAICAAIPDGPTRDADLRELVPHIHAVQHAFMANAAARAYPQTYRALGRADPAGGGTR